MYAVSSALLFAYLRLVGHRSSSLSTSMAAVFGRGVAAAAFFLFPPLTTIYWGCLFMIWCVKELVLVCFIYKDFLGGLLEPIAYAISWNPGTRWASDPQGHFQVHAQMLRIKKIVDGKG